MISLVLDCAGEEPAAAELDLFSVLVQRPDVTASGRRIFGVNLGEAQASFRAGDGVAPRLQFGVDQHQRHEIARVGGEAVQLDRRRAIGDAAHVKDGELQGTPTCWAASPTPL